jgi:hypothetical protein
VDNNVDKKMEQWTVEGVGIKKPLVKTRGYYRLVAMQGLEPRTLRI